MMHPRDETSSRIWYVDQQQLLWTDCRSNVKHAMAVKEMQSEGLASTREYKSTCLQQKNHKSTTSKAITKRARVHAIFSNDRKIRGSNDLLGWNRVTVAARGNSAGMINAATVVAADHAVIKDHHRRPRSFTAY